MKTRIRKQGLIAIAAMFAALLVPNVYSMHIVPEKEITQIDQLRNYQDSYIKGEVTRIMDEDEFRLQDSSGHIKVYTGWKNTHMVKKGEKVTIRGKQDPGVIKEFYATEIIREDGTVISLKAD